MYNVDIIRGDFPILQREVHGRKLVYLDNAATTQKPLAVLDAMRNEYLNVNANVHRGVHYLSQQATELHEAARERVRSIIEVQSLLSVPFAMSSVIVSDSPTSTMALVPLPWAAGISWTLVIMEMLVSVLVAIQPTNAG